MPVVPVAPTTVFMFNLLNYPRLLFFVFLLLLWLASNLGGMYGKKSRALAPDEREDFDVVLGATLSLLGLLIGFSFSMAISRYDQRKNYEEEEANAIGTEYARADLLGAQDADTIKKLL